MPSHENIINTWLYVESSNQKAKFLLSVFSGLPCNYFIICYQCRAVSRTRTFSYLIVFLGQWQIEMPENVFLLENNQFFTGFVHFIWIKLIQLHFYVFISMTRKLAERSHVTLHLFAFPSMTSLTFFGAQFTSTGLLTSLSRRGTPDSRVILQEF